MDTLVCPLRGLENSWPTTLYVIKQEATGKFGVYCHQDIFGVAAFSTEELARSFGGYIHESGMTILQVSFEEAREIAKLRPLPVVSLMLLDELEKPQIHFVR